MMNDIVTHIAQVAQQVILLIIYRTTMYRSKARSILVFPKGIEGHDPLVSQACYHGSVRFNLLQSLR